MATASYPLCVSVFLSFIYINLIGQHELINLSQSKLLIGQPNPQTLQICKVVKMLSFLLVKSFSLDFVFYSFI